MGGDADAQEQRYRYRQRHMGTLFQLTLYAGDEINANRAAKAAFEKIGDLDNALSDYKEESELNLLSASSGQGKAVALSEPLWDVLNFSKKLWSESSGAFDITVGPFAGAWREARKSKRLPTGETLWKLSESVGSQHLELKERSAKLKAKGMRLDLGGIAKGYALDAAMHVLREDSEIRIALIDGGGDVLAGDPPPGRDSWNVAVRNPNGGEPWIYPIRNASMATSGDLYQFVEVDGKRYSHIVDPKTGLGLTHQIQVTIVAPTGMEADALASAVSVLGGEKGITLIDSRKECSAMLVQTAKSNDSDEASVIRTSRTKGFPEEKTSE